MSTVFFCNRFFYPDRSATSQLLSDLAFGLQEGGLEVCVVTSRLDYENEGIKLAAAETIRGVRVLRVASTRLGRLSKVRRGVDYLSYFVTSTWKLLVIVKRGDCIVAATDPPLTSIACMIVAVLKGATLVNWLQDLFPEVARRLDVPLICGPLYGLLKAARNASLRHAGCNVVIGERMRDLLIREGIESDRVFFVPNWSDGKAVRPVPHDRNPLSSEWNLENKFVVAYSGNLGAAHESETMLQAIRGLTKDERIHFVFIGGGSTRRRLEQAAVEEGLPNVTFRAYQPRENLANSLSMGHVHLITLIPALEGLIVPSKFYGILAAGRASVFIGSASGEIGRIVAARDVGLTVASGDGDQLADILSRLASEPARVAAMGARARALFDELYDRETSIASWRQVLARVV